MILAFIAGFISGWLLSMPIGPINAATISRTLQYGFKFGFAVGLGAAVMDFIYCGGAAQIHEFLSRSPLVNIGFQAAGCIALAWLAVTMLRKKEETKKEADAKSHEKEVQAEHRLERLHLERTSILSSLLIGIVLYATNVAAVPEWLIISGFWRENGFLQTGVLTNGAFALGAGVGTGGWYLTLVRYFNKRKTGFKPHTLYLINRISGYALVLFVLYFLYLIIFTTNWPDAAAHWKALF